MTPNYSSILDALQQKTVARRSFNDHPLSNDMDELRTRSWRLWRRLHGERLTMHVARSNAKSHWRAGLPAYPQN